MTQKIKGLQKLQTKRLLLSEINIAQV